MQLFNNNISTCKAGNTPSGDSLSQITAAADLKINEAQGRNKKTFDAARNAYA